MEASFPIKLGLLAKRAAVRAPGAPEGRAFGVVWSGARLPQGGSCYVVEFDPASNSHARIVGYVDRYGRAFPCDGELAAPPAQTPAVRVEAGGQEAAERGAGGVAWVAMPGEPEHVAAEFSVAGAGLSRATFRLTGVESFPGEFVVPALLPYRLFMGTLFLSLYRFRVDGLLGEAVDADAFDLGAIFERFATSDVFDAVNREVLEAEASWAEHPEGARGIERLLVHLLREAGLVGASAEELAVARDALEAPASVGPTGGEPLPSAGGAALKRPLAEAGKDGAPTMLAGAVSVGRTIPAMPPSAASSADGPDSAGSSDATFVQGFGPADSAESRSTGEGVGGHAPSPARPPVAASAPDSSAPDAPAGGACAAAVSEEGPNARLIRTANYADTYYVDFFYNTKTACVEDGAFNAHLATADARARLLRTEAAMNRFLLLARFLEQSGDVAFLSDEALCAETELWLTDRAVLQMADAARPQDEHGRWATHLAFAREVEGWRLPYRVSCEFTSNVETTELGIVLACPPATLVAASRWSRDAGGYVPATSAERNGMAARYAAHAAVLAAASAFHASADIERAAVECRWAQVGFPAVLSVSVSRKEFLDAVADATMDDIVADPFAFLSRFDAGYDFDADFALRERPASFVLGAGEFGPSFEGLVAQDSARFSPRARELFLAARPKDMTIFEEGRRRVKAAEVVSALEQGVPAAMDKLKSVHDRTEDLVTRRVCKGLLADFASGAIGEQSYLEVREAFVDAYGFKPLMTRASALMRDDDPRAVAVLEQLRDKVAATQGFRDTKLSCWRYFDSYESRVIYAMRCADDAAGRSIMPLPDEAYLVHDALAQVLTTSITGAGEALGPARRCIELGPSRAYSYLRAARAHFMRDEYADEVHMCAKALEMSWNVRDAGLALYWIAYAFWKLGKYDAAVACYRRCIALDSTMADQAQMELEGLLGEVKGLQRHTPEEEAELLADEGVDVNALRDNALYLLECAQAAVDSGAVSLGGILAASASRIVRDDALLPTVRSLGFLTK